MASLYLIRHGEIDANVQQRWHGSTDSELNPNGVSQAARMGEYVNEKYPDISIIYSSPLKRTLETADALSRVANTELVCHSGLREFGIGKLEDAPYLALLEDHRFFDAIEENHNYRPSGGESVNQVRDRMLSAAQEIRDRHTGEHVALVSHGAAIAILLSQLFNGIPFPFSGYHMSNTGVTLINWDFEPKLISFDETLHLA